MPTLWVSYSTIHGLDAPEPPNSPYSLTWNVGRYLRIRAHEIGYAFEYRNLDAAFEDTIGADDIVIGHTWYPIGWMSGALASPAKAKFILQPYQHDIVGRNESWWIKALAAKADHLFFVTGSYWWDTMEQGLYGEWKAKATRLDMAINPALHPHSKTKWCAPGKRGVLAIGADIPYKGLDLIADFARCGGFRLGYYGNAPHERFQHVPQFIHYGGAGFTPEIQMQITSDYDFFVSLARGDACPTTLLETASWGLLPLCNELSGYWPNEPFLELRKDDMLFNLGMMDRLQLASTHELQQQASNIRVRVLLNHSWDQFCATLWGKMKEWL